MAVGSDYLSVPGLLAGEDLSSAQYAPVKLASTAGEVVQAGAGDNPILGILQNDPADGEAAVVAIAGVVRALAGTSTITAGESLRANSTGLVDTTSDNTGIVAIAIEASSASGDIISVLVGARRY